jgi:hypothetical protein
MAAALDETWEKLQVSGSRLARPAYSRAMREVVAKRIFEMARNGIEIGCDAFIDTMSGLH